MGEKRERLHNGRKQFGFLSSRRHSRKRGSAGNNLRGSPGEGTLERSCAWHYASVGAKDLSIVGSIISDDVLCDVFI